MECHDQNAINWERAEANEINLKAAAIHRIRKWTAAEAYRHLRGPIIGGRPPGVATAAG